MTIGGEILHSLLGHCFNRPVYPVNPCNRLKGRMLGPKAQLGQAADQDGRQTDAS